MSALETTTTTTTTAVLTSLGETLIADPLYVNPCNEMTSYGTTTTSTLVWRVDVYVLILVACFVVSTATIIFAIHHRLCGHCVIWWHDSRRFRFRLSSLLHKLKLTSAAPDTHDYPPLPAFLCQREEPRVDVV